MKRLVLVAVLVVVSSRAANAQTAGQTAAAETTGTAAAFSLFSTTVGIPLTGLGVAIYGLYTTMKDGKGGGGDVAAEAYLRSHSLQLAQDLTTGSGPALADLAAAAEIRATDTKAFGQLLRAHRAELLGLANVEKLDRARATQFMQAIGALVKGDKALSVNFAAYVQNHQG